MSTIAIQQYRFQNRYLIWLIGVSFLLFQFFIQLSSGVVLGKIMEEMKYTALITGALSSAFYYVYIALQIPVGILFDRYNTGNLLSVNALICAIGCFVFAFGVHYNVLFVGRVIMGAGAAFAFVGLSQLLREQFPIQQFAFMISLSDTLGFLVTVLGMISMGYLISSWGWRGFMFSAGIFGILISILCRKFIPKSTSFSPASVPVFKRLLSIISNPLTWINGLFSGLGFTVITVFGSLWAVPFIHLKLECSLFQASAVASMIFLGAALGLPIIGKLYILSSKRKPLIHASCLVTAALLSLLIFLPSKNLLLSAFLMFSIGLCCGGYILAFAIANELVPQELLSTCTGFTNTLAMITAPMLQPFIGYILDNLKQHEQYSVLQAYQYALMILPLGLFLSSLLVCFLPEKKAS